MKTTIDLHYLTHEEAQKDLLKFIDDLVLLGANFDVDVITGNSPDMKQLAINILDEYNLEYTIGDMYNSGYIRLNL